MKDCINKAVLGDCFRKDQSIKMQKEEQKRMRRGGPILLMTMGTYLVYSVS